MYHVFIYLFIFTVYINQRRLVSVWEGKMLGVKQTVTTCSVQGSKSHNSNLITFSVT